VGVGVLLWQKSSLITAITYFGGTVINQPLIIFEFTITIRNIFLLHILISNRLQLTTDASEVITNSDVIIIAVPSAYAETVLGSLDHQIFKGKKIISAIKGIPAYRKYPPERLFEKRI
jgi:glycerol-3-phosphate dehydrogenase